MSKPQPLSQADKIKGLIYGCAVGNALGMGTVLMHPREVSRHYPNGLQDYSQIISGAAQSLVEKGAITSQTASLLITARALIIADRFDCLAVAKYLHKWYNEYNIFTSSQERWLFGNKEYPDNPFKTALDVWIKMGGNQSSNESLTRIPLAGLWKENIEADAAELCRITHPSPRCVGCSEALAGVVAAMMWYDKIENRDEVLAHITHAHSEIEPYVTKAWADDIDALQLHDEATYWYVRKSMAAAFWAIWHTDNFLSGLEGVILRGGHAITNGALAGALLGIKHGYNAIPRHLVDGLIHKDIIAPIADDLTDYLCRKYPDTARRDDDHDHVRRGKSNFE